MGVRSKVLTVVLLASVVVGAFSLQSNNSSLFKGQIFEQPEEDVSTSLEVPDLTPQLEFLAPRQEGGDLSANVTIENKGAGELSGEQQFTYKIYINDLEVFSNTDSYTTMLPGDSFNFIYPIPRLIYQYPNEGTIKVVLDEESNVEESDETNNSASVEYSF